QARGGHDVRSGRRRHRQVTRPGFDRQRLPGGELRAESARAPHVFDIAQSPRRFLTVTFAAPPRGTRWIEARTVDAVGVLEHEPAVDRLDPWLTGRHVLAVRVAP